jgi:hypothetical protein
VKPPFLTTTPSLISRATRSSALALLAIGTWLATGCGGQQGPARHPVAEMTARSSAKLEVIPLVVSDPRRAERVREVFAELATIGRDFDTARARSVMHAREEWARRGAVDGQAPAATAEELELLLAPPMADGRAAYARYTALMLEVRGLLSEAEFGKLDRVR